MADNECGYMGGLSGRMGNLVAFKSGGKVRVRKRPEFPKNRKFTPAQELHKLKFQVAAKFYRSVSDLLLKTYEGLSRPRLVRNAVIGQLLNQAVEGNAPDLFVNPSEVMMARGTLKKPTSPTVESTQPGILQFNWNSRDVEATRQSDKSILVAYNPETEEIWYTVSGPQRVTLQGQLEMPFFSGKELHTWISFISEDGTKVADSVYTGTVLIA